MVIAEEAQVFVNVRVNTLGTSHTVTDFLNKRFRMKFSHSHTPHALTCGVFPKVFFMN